MSLEKNIKDWVHLDNKCKKLNDEIKEIKDKKNDITNLILNYCNDNKIKPTINISDGMLKLVDISQSNALSYKFLQDCFQKYYKTNEEEADRLLEFIKNERTYTSTTSIKRIYK